MQFRHLITCVVIILASVAGNAAADKYQYAPMPTDGSAKGEETAPAACAAVEGALQVMTDERDSCRTQASQAKTKCDDTIEAYRAEVAVCRGTTVEEVAKEMEKPEGKRWTKRTPTAPGKRKGDKPALPSYAWVKRIVPLGPFDLCPYGALAIERGPDKNKNGALDDHEVSDKHSSIGGCNGAPGTPGANGADGEKGETGAPGEKGDRGERGADGASIDRIKVGPYLRSTFVMGAGEGLGYMTSVGVRLCKNFAKHGGRVEWCAEGGFAPTLQKGLQAQTSVTVYGDSGIGPSIGFYGHWIDFDDTNHARAQVLGVTPGIAYRNGGFRAELTFLGGWRGSYGDTVPGAVGGSAVVSFGW